LIHRVSTLSFPGRGDLSGGWLVNLFDQRAWGMHLSKVIGERFACRPGRNNSVLPLLLNYYYYYCESHNGI
jgi:hypothetical protein